MNKDTPTESNGEQTDSKHRKLTRRRKCSGRREIHSIDSGNSNDEKLWHSLVLWFARKFSTKFATWKVLTILCHCLRRLVLFPLAVFCKYKAYILRMKWLDPIYRSMRMKLLDPSCGAWLLSPTNVCTTMTDAQQFFSHVTQITGEDNLSRSLRLVFNFTIYLIEGSCNSNSNWSLHSSRKWDNN